MLGCKANLTWSTSVNNGCPLTMYSVYHQQLQPRETGAIWHEINITDVLKTSHVLLLKCDTQHIIEMSAWNELGKSDRSKTWIIKTLSGGFENWHLCVSKFSFLGCCLVTRVMAKLSADYIPRNELLPEEEPTLLLFRQRSWGQHRKGIFSPREWQFLFIAVCYASSRNSSSSHNRCFGNSLVSSKIVEVEAVS